LERHIQRLTVYSREVVECYEALLQKLD